MGGSSCVRGPPKKVLCLFSSLFFPLKSHPPQKGAALKNDFRPMAAWSISVSLQDLRLSFPPFRCRMCVFRFHLQFFKIAAVFHLSVQSLCLRVVY